MTAADRTHPEFWFAEAKIPRRFWALKFSDYDVEVGSAEALDAAREFDSHLGHGDHNGVGLTLLGPPGRGKTMLASILATRHILRNPAANVYEYTPPVYFGSLARFQRTVLEPMELERMSQLPGVFPDNLALRWHDNLALRDHYREVELLVVDDLGWEHRSKSAHIERQLDLLLRERFDLGHPTILTSNLKINEISREYSVPFQSFLHEATSLVAVPGADVRSGS